MTTLDERVREYQKLLDRKKELEDLTKENNQAKEALEQEICKMMIDEEKPSTVVDGYNYSLQEKTMYTKKSEEDLMEAGLDFFSILRDQGLGDIIVERVDPRTLNSACASLAEESTEEGSDAQLPEELEACLNIYQKLSLSRRKANTKALSRAKANMEES